MPRGDRPRQKRSAPPISPEAAKPAPSTSPAKPARKIPKRCNELDGKRWLQNSISVWSDLRKSTDELRLKHPALFPTQLVERLIASFLPGGPHRILDPFAGTGSTLVAAQRLGKSGVGFELSPDFCETARGRLRKEVPADKVDWTLHEASAAHLRELVPAESIDLCVTSPPYWNILTRQRTADHKEIRHYGNRELDLGTIDDYDEFLTALTQVFADVLTLLKPGAHCCIVVMDLRRKNRFYPFHSDLATRLVSAGYILDDLIVWNRQTEYNNLRPLGYPAVFRINKVHEFIVLMQKPK